ncbi:MAG: 16S rRNA (guanine(527)-N(7))-methyltransferase RsmG [Candidatus Limnocylindrales bacterium]
MHEERRPGPGLPLPTRSQHPLRAPLPTDPRTLPALPAVFRDAIAAACAAWEITLDDAALAALEGHARLLLAWTTAINLTALRTPEQVAVAHVLDSLSAIPLLRRRGPARPRLADLGSGGGYPGLALAVALPAREALLVESVGKKARFLEVAVAATNETMPAVTRPALGVEHRRAESLAGEATLRGHFDVVTARAVGSLAVLAAWGLPLLREGGLVVAWKREGGDGRLAAEVAAARDVAVGLGGSPPVVEALPTGVAALATHRLVVIRRVRSEAPGTRGSARPRPGRGQRLLG